MRRLVLVGMVVLAAGAASGFESDDAERARREQAVARHLLRVQRERFEAKARGESPERIRRLDRELRRTQERRARLLDDAAAR